MELSAHITIAKDLTGEFQFGMVQGTTQWPDRIHRWLTALRILGSDFNESDLVTGYGWLRVDDSTKASTIIHSNFSMDVVAFALWKVRSLEFDPPCLRQCLKKFRFYSIRVVSSAGRAADS